MTSLFAYIIAALIMSMMGAVSILLGRKNGRGPLFNFVAGAFFGPFAWVSVPYLRPRPNPPHSVVVDERGDDTGSEDESGLDFDPGEDSSDQRKIIRNCILVFLGIWFALEMLERFGLVFGP